MKKLGFTPMPIPSINDGETFQVNDWETPNSPLKYTLRIDYLTIFKDIPTLPLNLRRRYCPTFKDQEYNNLETENQKLAYISTHVDKEIFQFIIRDLRTFTERQYVSIAVKGKVYLMYPDTVYRRGSINRESLLFVEFPENAIRALFKPIRLMMYLKDEDKDLWKFASVQNIKLKQALAICDTGFYFLIVDKDFRQLNKAWNLDQEKYKYSNLLNDFLNKEISFTNFKIVFLYYFQQTVKNKENLRPISKVAFEIEFGNLMDLLIPIKKICENEKFQAENNSEFQELIRSIFSKFDD